MGMERDVRRGRVVLCPGSFCNTTATWVRCGLFHSLQTSKLKSFLHMGHPRCLMSAFVKGELWTPWDTISVLTSEVFPF